MFPELESIRNVFLLMAKADPSVIFTDKLQMHILEAAEKKIDRVAMLPPALGGWINFIYYSHLKSEEEMSTLLNGDPILKQAYEKFLQFNQDEELCMLDEDRQKFLYDYVSDIEEARTNSKAEAKFEIARNMKELGIGIDLIVQATGLSSEVIEQLD
jgi:predicted transposase/invertase (TIGR01784 family)